jgi:hypothetical protein
MWYDGKKVDEELLKIVEPKRKNVEPAESEILTETCPDERKEGSVYNEEEVLKEGIENLSENDNVKQVKEQQETYDEYSIKYFEGINDILMSKKQNKGIREEAQVEIIEQGEDKKEEDVAKNIESFSEKGEESNEHQNEEKIIVDNVQNRANIVKEHQIEDKACSDNFTSQEPEESEENVSAENTKMISTKESTKDVSDSLNADTVIKTDENGKDKVSKENVQERSLDNTCTVINTDENGKDKISKDDVSPELHFQRTQHTEKLVREINIEIKTPSETMSKTPMCRYAERIVPASISRGQSKEELDAVQNRSATPKLKHAEKIVPGCISHSRLADSDKGDKVKSAPTTPIVSRSERTLQRVLSYEECGQRTPTSPKLIHDDRIVPGSISREESQEETYPFPPQLPHAEKIVPGSISRDISDEALESKLLQAAVMETPDQRSAEADPTSVAEVQP